MDQDEKLMKKAGVAAVAEAVVAEEWGVGVEMDQLAADVEESESSNENLEMQERK